MMNEIVNSLNLSDNPITLNVTGCRNLKGKAVIWKKWIAVSRRCGAITGKFFTSFHGDSQEGRLNTRMGFSSSMTPVNCYLLIVLIRSVDARSDSLLGLFGFNTGRAGTVNRIPLDDITRLYIPLHIDSTLQHMSIFTYYADRHRLTLG